MANCVISPPHSLAPDVVSFPDPSDVSTFVAAAELLREAGFEPRLVFGDAQGEIRSYEIDGVEPEVGQTFRRGSIVEISAL